jgi:hypothetical protein
LLQDSVAWVLEPSLHVIGLPASVLADGVQLVAHLGAQLLQVFEDLFALVS